MQTATSETESKSRDLSICVHHYTLRAPCPKGQGKNEQRQSNPPNDLPQAKSHNLWTQPVKGGTTGEELLYSEDGLMESQRCQ